MPDKKQEVDWRGDPVRPLEWNSKHVRRCSKCQRLGPKEKYKAGPLKIVDGETVRTYVCDPQPCAPPRVEHFQNAHPPKRYEGDDPPRRAYVETMKYPKRRQSERASERALRADMERMDASAKQTSRDALSREGGTDPMKHPSPKFQGRNPKGGGRKTRMRVARKPQRGK